MGRSISGKAWAREDVQTVSFAPTEADDGIVADSSTLKKSGPCCRPDLIPRDSTAGSARHKTLIWGN
jgi:hypothetical protein